MSAQTTEVSVLMGSQSDWKVMKRAISVLEELGIKTEAKIISAHRKPARLHSYITEAEEKGVKVFIAGAGMAAHLPGVISSLTTRPVLGVPLNATLDGMDSLLAIVQMPGGIPVGTLGIGGAGAKNAGLLAAAILATGNDALCGRIKAWRKAQAEALHEDPLED
jgi:5-(carboxyamino)imidazole ribonucleotide mutase